MQFWRRRAWQVNGWLEHLSAALLSLASLDDHRFLLQAIVRCGSGLNESLVKCLHLPKDAQQWNNDIVDHALALLGCMLSQINPPARGKRATSDFEMVELFKEQLNGAADPEELRTIGDLVRAAKEERSIDDNDLAMLRELYLERAAAIDCRGASRIEENDVRNSTTSGDGADGSHAPSNGAAGKAAGKVGDSHYAALLDCFPLGQLLQFVLRLPMPSDTVQGLNAAHHHGGWRTAGATAAAMPHTEQTVVEVFAYIDALLRVLFTGFAGVGATEFPLLALRAGRAISDIFAGVSHFWETSPGLASVRAPRLAGGGASASGGAGAGGGGGDPSATPVVLISAAHVELDQLVMRTLSWFFSDPLESVWPFVAELPYNVLSPPAAWRVLCFVFTNGQASLGREPHAEWQALVQQKVHRERFADGLMLMPQRSAEYVLAMLANLARSRDARPDDADGRALVQAIFVELFAAACLHAQTRVAFSRQLRDQLASIASTHPWLLSTLIRLLGTNFVHVGRVAIYLLRAMPLNIWQPTANDILLVQQWLEQPFASPAHLSAREVVDLLAISSRPTDLTRLGLPPDIHLALAFAVAHGYRKHVDGGDAAGRTQRSKIAMLQSADVTMFESWCWKVLLMLEPWKTLPVDVETSLQLAPLLTPASRASPIIACAVLLVSSAGRTARAFQDHGVHLLSTLIEHRNNKAAVYCLTFALPSVVQDATQLVDVASNVKLVHALETLLQSDRSSVPLAGNLLFSKDYTNELLLLGMLRSNLYSTATSARGHSPQQQYSTALSFARMVEFWLQLVCSCDGWFSNEVARRLLDVVLAASFAWSDGRVVAQRVLDLSHAAAVADAIAKRVEARKGVSGVLSWISGAAKYDGDILSFADGRSSYVESVATFFKSSSATSSAASQPIALRQVPTCLVFECLVAETRKEASIREKVGAALIVGGPSALEKSAKELKMSIGSFRVYRWAHYCTVLDPEEGLLPVFWQMFFALYFASSKGTAGSQVENTCYGNLYFAGGIGRGMINTLKARLGFLAEWHAAAANGGTPSASRQSGSSSSGGGGSAASDTTDAAADAESDCEWSCTRVPLAAQDPRPPSLHRELAQLYTIMLAWLCKEPAALHDFAGSSVRPQHVGVGSGEARLVSVICDHPWKVTELHTLWRDLLPRELDSKADAFRESLLSRLRVLAVPTQGTRRSGGGLLQRDRSKDFEGVPTADGSLMQPATIDAALLASLPAGGVGTANLIYQQFEDDLTELSTMASLYGLQVTNVSRLDHQYLHALPALHVNDPQQITQKVKCVKRMGTPCLGAGAVVFELTQQRVVASVKKGLTMNRKEVISELDGPPVPDNCNKAAYRVLSRVESLVRLVTAGVAGAKQHATQLFYTLLRTVDEEIQLHPPSRAVYNRAVGILGARVIAGSPTEMKPLLDLCFEIPERTFLVQPFFNPSLCVQAYPSLYHAACNAIMLSTDHIGALLEQFHLQEWLDDAMCNGELRGAFVRVVVEEIKNCTERRRGGGGRAGVDGATPPTTGMPDTSDVHVLQLHSNNLDLITRDKFPLQYGDVLRSLVVNSSKCSMPDECWMTFLATVASNQKLVPLEDRTLSVQWLERTFLDIRGASGSLYPIFSGATVHLCQLYRFLMQCAIAEPSYRLADVFDRINRLFSPWLSTLPSLATQGVWQPWPQTSEEISSARDMLNELLLVVGMLAPLNEAMAAVWQFYVSALAPHAEPYVLEVIHDTLEKMPWSSLQIGPAELLDMLALLTPNAAATSYLFMASVICKSNIGWRSLAAGNAQNHDAIAYHTQLFAVMLRIAAHPAVSQSYDMELLGNVVRTCAWKHVQPNGFAVALGEFERECDATGLFHRATPAYHGMFVLRSAAAIERANDDPATVEKFRLYSGLYCRLVQRAGDAVTDENLVWLLKGLMGDIQSSTGSTFEALAGSAFRLLNGFQTGTPQSAALIAGAVAWVEQEPRHALMLLRVTCLSVAAIPEMAQLAEACIAQHTCFAASRLGPSAATHMMYWDEICAHLAVPQLEGVYRTFVRACTKGPYPLTLHAHLLQLAASTTASAADKMPVLAAATQWVKELEPTPAHGSERVFLLWAKVLELAENANAGGVLSQATAAQEAVLNVLVDTAEQRSSAGISGFFGRGAFKFSLEVRLFCRALAASIAGRIANDEPSQKRAAKLLSSIDSLKKEVATKEGGNFTQAMARLDLATEVQLGDRQKSSKTMIGRMVELFFKEENLAIAILRPPPISYL